MGFWRRMVQRFWRPTNSVTYHNNFALFSGQNVNFSHLSFGSFRPKCLPNVNYISFLRDGVENFSPDCWLENHLHQFAQPESFLNTELNNHGYDTQTFSSTSSSSTDSLTISSSGSQMEEIINDLNIQLHSYVESPPLYDEDPPPSYEEAIRDGASRSFNSNNDFWW
ncbi:hypothetical protein SNE40_007556 [Patella caerulea]|uniref:Uncharacterized protein n=1 Tax=Patella caerulea TaxID=87958 RepID=A0AAN8JY61_PATCE